MSQTTTPSAVLDTYRALHPKSEALYARARGVIPGGITHDGRNLAPFPVYVDRAKGSHKWDVDGNEYIDYHAGFAPYILGHNDPDQNEAVAAALRSGRSNYGSGPTADEGELARLFLACLPMAERVQFFNTGSEATAQAIRVARAFTGRNHVIRMQGGYNGNQNVVAVNLMTSAADLGGVHAAGGEYPVVPITAGIPECERALLHPVPFNDLAAVEAVAKRHPIAALITEPALQNIGVVKPGPGYLEGLRALADRYGSALDVSCSVDVSPELISAAKEHAGAAGLSIDYRAGDIAQLEGRFDLVTCMGSLEHFLDKPAAYVFDTSIVFLICGST